MTPIGSNCEGPEEFARNQLHVCVARILHQLGFTHSSQSSLDILSDLMRRYMESVCANSRRFADHCVLFSYKNNSVLDIQNCFLLSVLLNLGHHLLLDLQQGHLLEWKSQVYNLFLFLYFITYISLGFLFLYIFWLYPVDVDAYTLSRPASSLSVTSTSTALAPLFKRRENRFGKRKSQITRLDGNRFIPEPILATDLLKGSSSYYLHMRNSLSKFLYCTKLEILNKH
uniref:BTP domain-containing protein n=1 Tax=Heterorhabditis bacteriophora TaxID=37862 RepID=A0A1I7XGJ9_HETBA